MKLYYIAAFQKLWDEEMYAKTFEALGHEVVRREERGFPNKYYIEDIKKERPDAVIFAKLLTDESPVELLHEIKKLGILTLSWTFDLFLGYYRENDVYGAAFFKADIVCTTDGGHDARWKEIGINHYTVRQGILDEQCFLGEKDWPMHDVIFVGTENPNHPYRYELCDFLAKHYDFKWYGRKNPDEVRSTKLNNLYANSKIVIGDSVPSPNYWSNRVYETLGRGGFMVYPWTEGIEKEYEPYKHFIPYHRGKFDELKQIIDYYLTDDEARKKIQLAAIEHSKKYHLVSMRCQKILELLAGGITG